jgi:hypothetical protein
MQKQELLKRSTTDKLSLEYRVDGVLKRPVSATISIYSGRGGSIGATEGVLLLGPVSVTPDADDVLRYAPGLTVTGELAENMRADWAVTFNGETTIFRQLFDIVLGRLEPLLTDADLAAECPSIYEEPAYGKLEAATVDSITDVQLRGHEPKEFAGDVRVYIPSTGEEAIVASFERSTGTLILASSFSAAPSPGTGYCLARGYAAARARAWDDLMQRVRSHGNRPALIMNGEALVQPHLYLSLAKVCRGRASEKGDTMWALADYYDAKAETAFTGLAWVYDSDQDSIPDTVVRPQAEFDR